MPRKTLCNYYTGEVIRVMPARTTFGDVFDHINAQRDTDPDYASKRYTVKGGKRDRIYFWYPAPMGPSLCWTLAAA